MSLYSSARSRKLLIWRSHYKHLGLDYATSLTHFRCLLSSNIGFQNSHQTTASGCEGERTIWRGRAKGKSFNWHHDKLKTFLSAILWCPEHTPRDPIEFQFPHCGKKLIPDRSWEMNAICLSTLIWARKVFENFFRRIDNGSLKSSDEWNDMIH